MCCLFTALFLLGPRAAVIIWWILDPARWSLAFSSVLWPIIGVVLLPWTTLMWVIVAPGGVAGLDWLWLGLAVLLDVSMWSGSAWGNRDRLPGSSKTA
jgi:hypothetical protein